MKKFDAIIIGFGKGGKTLASALVKQGMTVAIIERSSSMYGGTCINIACIPMKSLVEQAEKSVNYAKAISKKDDLTAFLREKNFNNLDQKDGITFLTGEASFVSPHEVKVELESETVTLSAEYIFINTGAESVIPREDRDIAEAIQQTLEKKGIQFKLNVKVKTVEGSLVAYEDGDGEHKIEADAVLLATGRKPYTEGLNLEAAGVNITDRGTVQVDETLRTNVPHIWAIGDVNGGPQFTYISIDKIL
ncbi:FAD-dependent oxidoreductase [Bacillus sp. 37MA]|uniref:FAD-dependent oxidoreductase n=1 Tax=Bacillus sp. 37MA TaxID=1132442 RepID=UPI00036CE626|nr:FAD-dependent oxidoreductase [Bacillus sp. 37MA]